MLSPISGRRSAAVSIVVALFLLLIDQFARRQNRAAAAAAASAAGGAPGGHGAAGRRWRATRSSTPRALPRVQALHALAWLGPIEVSAHLTGPLLRRLLDRRFAADRLRLLRRLQRRLRGGGKRLSLLQFLLILFILLFPLLLRQSDVGRRLIGFFWRKICTCRGSILQCNISPIGCGWLPTKRDFKKGDSVEGRITFGVNHDSRICSFVIVMIRACKPWWTLMRNNSTRCTSVLFVSIDVYEMTIIQLQIS